MKSISALPLTGVPALAFVLALAPTAFSAGELTLSNLRLEPTPLEAYRPLVFRADDAGAQQPLTRLWWRILREGQKGEPTALPLAKERFGGPAA